MRSISRMLMLAVVGVAGCGAGVAAEGAGESLGGLSFSMPAVKDGDSAGAVRAKLEAFVKANAGASLRVTVREDDPGQGLRVSCPVSVRCDASFYRAFKMYRPELYLYFSFDGKLVGNLTTDALQQHFSYANLMIHLPQLSSSRWRVRDGAFDPVLRKGDARVAIQGIRDGRLQATITGELASIRAELQDGHCEVMDAPQPADCRVEVPANIPYVIDVDVALDPTAVLDCTDPAVRDRCG